MRCTSTQRNSGSEDAPDDADRDIGVTWEQWSIEVPPLGGPDDTTVLESGPDEQWWMVPGQYRDERCATPPDEWDPAWR